MNKLIRVPLAAFLVATVSVTIANAAGRRVAASDVIQIHILNQPDLDTQVRVAPEEQSQSRPGLRPQASPGRA
jgi:hypothetical protein